MQLEEHVTTLPRAHSLAKDTRQLAYEAVDGSPAATGCANVQLLLRSVLRLLLAEAGCLALFQEYRRYPKPTKSID